MKKISTRKERNQLKYDADFLEGFFSVKYALTKRSDILEAVLILVVTIFMVCSFMAFVFFTGYRWILLWVLISLLFIFLMVTIVSREEFKYSQESRASLLSEEDICINWVTIVNVDRDNRIISYIEDEALSPDNRRYIVDYIATPGDCKKVVKGERILIVHIGAESGKPRSLLMIPGPGFELMRDSQECGPVRIGGLEHIPHKNAFIMNKRGNSSDKEETEVIFWATSKSGVIKPLPGANSNTLTRIYVYEWKGRAFVRKCYIMRRTLKCEYGDILIKKYDKLGKVYFQAKEF